mmetsp:Transcript_15872/g.23740  ORF Transcript_15872/g.23740 Transcript_15872/m.23740 type:complete len:308 (+) Transcript_15872:117-1040(+)
MRRQLCLHFVEHLLIIISTTSLTCGLVPAHNLNNRHTTIHSTNNRARILLAATTTDDTDAATTTIVDEQLTKQLGSAFTQKLTELEEYKKKHGNCLVPRRYEENPSLGNFVNKQRQSYRKFLMGEKSSMNDRRINALNQLGFVWDASSTPRSSHSDKAWQKMYSELTKFHATNGHCRVPSTSTLGQWVVRQRFLYRQYPNRTANSSLTPERISELNKLSFPWTTRSEQLWQERINDLMEYKRKHGDCMVPRKYPPNEQLAAWVATQRKNYNRREKGQPSPLTIARIQELEELGFVWSYWDFNLNNFQ